MHYTKIYTGIHMQLLSIALHHWPSLRFCLCNRSMGSSMDTEIIYLCRSFYTMISVYIDNNFFSISAGSRVVICRHTGHLCSTYFKMCGFPKREDLHFPFQTLLSLPHTATYPRTECSLFSLVWLS